MKLTSPDALIQALKWISTTPNLFTSELSSFIADSPTPCDFILPEERDESLLALAHSLSQPSHLRLGIYYERLWHYWLHQQPHIDLIAHNLPVRAVDNTIKKTLGEFDIIYQHKERTVHRELAVKFYLGVPNPNLKDQNHRISSMNQWVGPGLKDRLDRKMQHMLSHQILLGSTKEGQQVLAERGLHAIEQEILVQGRLFYPLKGLCPAPEFSHPAHYRGLWMTLSDFKQNHPLQVQSTYHIMNKPQWISAQPQSPSISCDELLLHLENLAAPEYIYSGEQHIFIVPDDWPKQASLTAFSVFSNPKMSLKKT